MQLFDFHHHHSSGNFGIYNLLFEEKIPESFFSAGIHPNEIGENLETKMAWLKEVSLHENCVAIGECGLDGLIGIEDALQEEVFCKQLDWANHLQKPVIIHCVKRFSRLLLLCKNAEVPLIIHGFNKKKSVGQDLVNKDFYLSFGKAILENVNLQHFLEEVPLHQIFLETDDADFDLDQLYEKVAFIKNISKKTLVEQMKSNLQTLKIST
jgi:TatD DNase family protein